MSILFLQDKVYLDRYGFVDSFSKITYFDGNYRVSDFTLLQYEAAVSCVAHDELANYMMYRADKLGIPTVLLNDGVFDLANSTRNGISKKSGVQPGLTRVSRVIATCSQLGEQVSSVSGMGVVKYMPKFVYDDEDNEVNLGDVALITTANSPCFNSDEKAALIERIREVVSELSNRNIPIRLRIFEEGILEAVLSEVEPSCYELFNHGSFFDAMSGVSIAFTTHSSVSIPLVKNSIPTACFLYRSEPIEPCYGWYYFQGLDLPKMISEMRSRPIEKLNFQKSSFDSFDNKELGLIVSEVLQTNKPSLSPDKAQKMLESAWNFNVQFLFYKIYLKVKSFSIVKDIRRYLVER